MSLSTLELCYRIADQFIVPIDHDLITGGLFIALTDLGNTDVDNTTMPDDTCEDIAARYYRYEDMSEHFANRIIKTIILEYDINGEFYFSTIEQQYLAWQSDIIWC